MCYTLYMKTIKVKNKFSKQIYYFRFFSDKYPEKFYYTLTKDSYGFEIGWLSSFKPIRTTWKEIIKHEKRMDKT